ncbi:hypothetical protein K466DRAFT_599505 [Polyporus arcularius HHB13444]|uniref:Uncharacterized protein n=1 Tax=Polyporus arcularius HHB13444 TaxID=1314778 RepID=A0A5C3PEP7_9APHY|nr:hypothetical protein K466DRAFT_599505 [Polyporus arcularius HHB13444]
MKSDHVPLESNAGETETDIYRDITLLSVLLEDYRHGKSTLLDAKQTGGSSSELWSHVSYVLAPGNNSDTHGSNVVAVVGRIEPGTIVATVVAPNTSSEKARPKPVEVDQVDFLGIDEVADMFNNLIETLLDDVEFDVHLCDIMSIVSYLLQKHERPLDKAVTASYLFDFIVLRCHRKLYARLASGITLWTQHPLEALRDFHEKLSTAKAPGSTSTASTHQSAVGPDSPLCVTMPLAYMYTSLLKKHGITYDKDE